jgi:hypothetical protein
MNKKDIFENVRDYSPREIAAAIRQGVVTFYELKNGTHGQFTPLLQKQVQVVLDSGEEIGEEKGGGQGTEQQPEDPLLSTPQPESYTSPNEGATPLYTDLDPKPLNLETPGKSDGRGDSLITCPECGHRVSSMETECPECGMPLREEPNRSPQPSTVSSKKLGRTLKDWDAPESVKSFSWGGFVFGWIWGVFNGVYWSLLSLVPYVGLVVHIILGFKGNSCAWKSGKFLSKEDFERVQRGWNTAGIVFFSMFAFLVLLVFIGLTLD